MFKLSEILAHGALGPSHKKVTCDLTRPFSVVNEEFTSLMVACREDFRGPAGPRGADGALGRQGPQGPQGNPGRPPIREEIVAAVAAYLPDRERRSRGLPWLQVLLIAIPLWLIAAGVLASLFKATPEGEAMVQAPAAAPTAEEVAAAHKSDPVFMVAVTGPAGKDGAPGVQGIAGPAGKDVTPAQVASLLTANALFLASVRGRDGAPSPRGPAGPAGIQGPPGQSGGGLERLASCSPVWFPHVGSTGGFYYKCPDGFEFTLPIGARLTLEDAHARLRGEYPK